MPRIGKRPNNNFKLRPTYRQLRSRVIDHCRDSLGYCWVEIVDSFYFGDQTAFLVLVGPFENCQRRLRVESDTTLSFAILLNRKEILEDGISLRAYYDLARRI